MLGVVVWVRRARRCELHAGAINFLSRARAFANWPFTVPSATPRRSAASRVVRPSRSRNWNTLRTKAGVQSKDFQLLDEAQCFGTRPQDSAACPPIVLLLSVLLLADGLVE